MKSEASQNLKERSKFLKTKKKRTKLECPCIRFILSILKNKRQSTTISTSVNETNRHETSVEVDQKIEPETTLKKTKNSRVIRLPKIGCTIPFLMKLFNDLSNKGVMRLDVCDITRAVNIISNAKMDLDSGKAWSGKIEIAENLHLKLYKTGLVLHHKQ